MFFKYWRGERIFVDQDSSPASFITSNPGLFEFTLYLFITLNPFQRRVKRNCFNCELFPEDSILSDIRWITNFRISHKFWFQLVESSLTSPDRIFKILSDTSCRLSDTHSVKKLKRRPKTCSQTCY